MDSVAVPTVLMNHLTASRCVLLASFSAKLTECAMNHITAVMDGVYVETARMNGIATAHQVNTDVRLVGVVSRCRTTVTAAVLVHTAQTNRIFARNYVRRRSLCARKKMSAG
jgi:hypothetical protein